MESESRRIGARSTQYQLWVAAYVMAEETKRPMTEVLPKVLKVFEESVRQTDLRGTQSLQDKYEQASQRARDARRLAGKIDIDDPAVVRMITALTTTGEERPEASAAEVSVAAAVPAAAPSATAEAFLDDVFADLSAPPAAKQAPAAKQSNTDFYFDDIPTTALVDDILEDDIPSGLAKQQAELVGYSRYLIRHTKIPLCPCTRPGLGVTFFPTGRFDVGGVDWNYNGQISGVMIRDCLEDKLAYLRGAPLKSILEFKDWSFSKAQRVSGTIWVWAVRHEEGKTMRFWFNDGEDRLRFYYTMTRTGVTQVQKKPEYPGSKKFITVGERHFTAADIDFDS